MGVQQIVGKFLFFCFGGKNTFCVLILILKGFVSYRVTGLFFFFVAIIMTKLLLYDRKWLFLKMIKGVKVNILYLDTLELRKSSFTLPCGV